jgi:hypothetical protein
LGWTDLKDFKTAEDVDIPHVLLLLSMQHSDLHRPVAVHSNNLDPTVYVTETVLGYVVHGGSDQVEVKEEPQIHYVRTTTIDENLERRYSVYVANRVAEIQDGTDLNVRTTTIDENLERRYSVYVANRVAEIQDGTDLKSWNHVSTKDNPADHASRPMFVKADPNEDDRVKFWFHGPQFVLRPKSEWPNITIDTNLEDGDPEVLKTKSVFAVTKECDSETTKECISETIMSVVVKAHSLYKATVRIAGLMKFIKYVHDKVPPSALECADLAQAEKKIILLMQREAFPDEFVLLREGKKIPKSSPVWKLRPFLDPDSGIMRVGSHLQDADVSYEFRFPAILPKRGHFVEKLIVDTHQRIGHLGCHAVLTELRERFWLINAKSTVNHVLHRCLTCKKFYARI